jgi:prevent-host-death family protein
MMVMMRGEDTLSIQSRRIGVAEAKSKLSEVIRETVQGPTVIHSRGRDLAVLLTLADYERLLVGQATSSRSGGAAFLERVEALKERHGGGVLDFEPARLDFEPTKPFARKGTGRR